MSFDLRVKNRLGVRFLNRPAERGANRAWRGRSSQNLSNFRHDIGVPRARIKQRPTLPPINGDHLTNSSHGLESSRSPWPHPGAMISAPWMALATAWLDRQLSDPLAARGLFL